MHAAVLGVLRTANRPISRRACRIVAGSRYPLAHRSFNRSAISYKAPEDPKAEEVGKDSAVPEAPESKAELDTEPDAEPEAGAEAENEGSDQSIFSPEAGNLVLFNKVRNGKPGSGRVRAGLRSKAPEGVPPIVIPSWFWEKNVKLVGELDLGGSLSVEGEKLFFKSDRQRQYCGRDRDSRRICRRTKPGIDTYRDNEILYTQGHIQGDFVEHKGRSHPAATEKLEQPSIEATYHCVTMPESWGDFVPRLRYRIYCWKM